MVEHVVVAEVVASVVGLTSVVFFEAGGRPQMNDAAQWLVLPQTQGKQTLPGRNVLGLWPLLRHLANQFPFSWFFYF